MTATGEPIVLHVEVPITMPAPAKTGEFVVIYPDRIHIVRPAPNNQGGWLSQWLQGALAPVSEVDASRMYDLSRELRGPVEATPFLRVIR